MDIFDLSSLQSYLVFYDMIFGGDSSKRVNFVGLNSSVFPINILCQEPGEAGRVGDFWKLKYPLYLLASFLTSLILACSLKPLFL